MKHEPPLKSLDEGTFISAKIAPQGGLLSIAIAYPSPLSQAFRQEEWTRKPARMLSEANLPHP